MGSLAFYTVHEVLIASVLGWFAIPSSSGCNEHELVQTLGDGEGQGGLACRRPWGRKELDTTGQWNNFLKEMGTIPHYLPPEKRVCKSRSNSWNWTWNNRLVQNW